MTHEDYVGWVRGYAGRARASFAPPSSEDLTQYTLKFLDALLGSAAEAFAAAFPGHSAPSDVEMDIAIALTTPEGGTK